MKISKKTTLIILLLILIMQLFLRLPFLHEPLEGDEGIYASMAMWLNQGEVLYKDLIDLKPPLLFFTYLFIFKLFGWAAPALRVFTLWWGLAATFIVFLIGKKLVNEKLGLVAAFLFALFSGGPLIEGAGANSEVFMVLPLLLALLFCLKGREDTSWLVVAGLFSGLAVMYKQVAIFNFIALIPFISLALWKRGRGRSRGGWGEGLMMLLLGFFVVPLIFALYFLTKGAWPDFINSTFFYGLRNINPNIVFFLFRTAYIMLLENSVLWLLAFAGIILIWRQRKDNVLRFLTVWGLFSLLGVFVGGYAFGHYYIQIIPALCLLSGITIINWSEIRFKPVLIAVLVVSGLFIVVNQYKYYLVYTPEKISMAKYGGPVNVIAREIGLKIRSKTKPGDFIFPRLLYQIPLYAGRMSASKCYLSLGGRYSIVGADGQVLYTHDFKVRQKEGLLRREKDDFNQALNNRRTKYFIYLRGSAPPGLPKRLAQANYRYDRELSYPEYGVLVYKRIY